MSGSIVEQAVATLVPELVAPIEAEVTSLVEVATTKVFDGSAFSEFFAALHSFFNAYHPAETAVISALSALRAKL